MMGGFFADPNSLTASAPGTASSPFPAYIPDGTVGIGTAPGAYAWQSGRNAIYLIAHEEKHIAAGMNHASPQPRDPPDYIDEFGAMCADGTPFLEN